MLNLKVVNLYAGPGAGKSTLAAGLFNLLKNLGYRVELVTEFAKDTTYERNFGLLQNQLAILAEQDRRLRRLEGQVDWVITDSPLPLGIVYMTPEYEEWLVPAVWGAFRRYQNFHVLISRGDRAYQTYGRSQTLAEAMTLDTQIGHLFDQARDGEEDFAMEVLSDHEAPYRVFEELIDGEDEDDGAS
ncbi:AAA family ATPase [Aminobacter sp. HY435]|uniref:AAA family ATPase n=1 Tax=Aminobacter sp. HY435 TaxID=2970917 RepID=UPI0022B984AF|nr:AAA family ATPase [Aminobacter sp. HY435]